MNFNYNEEQEKIFAKAVKSACEFRDCLSKLNDTYQKKLIQTLLGYDGIEKLAEVMRNIK